jgi:quinoprotein glucose dehydrogenase
MAEGVRRRSRRRIIIWLAGLLAVIALAAVLTIWSLQWRPPQDSRSWDKSPPAPVADNLDWKAVGGDPGQTKYSQLAQIADRNVGRLEIAWTYRTGEMARRGKAIQYSEFEATPIIADNKLILCTPFDRAIALDPATGKEIWVFDAKIDTTLHHSNNFNCRGLARWVDKQAPPNTPCAERVYMATVDRRIFALDARTGARCAGFGTNGEVIAIPLSETHTTWDVRIVAAPAVVGDVVVIGSAVNDGHWAHGSSGKIRAFDARSGKLIWAFEPFPNSNGQTGGANVWGSLSADPDRGMVFLPTTSPSPDFFGGERKGDESLANAIVAIRASTGEKLWSFQTVHHDLWDYDIPAAPAMFTLHRGGQAIPALAFATKQGFLFVLDRLTGKPLYPVTERPVPKSDVPGERTAPTQPFSALPAIARQGIGPDDAFGIIGIDKMMCRRKIEKLRTGPIFTPPSFRGTAIAPSRAGGGEWGGVAIDPRNNRLIVNSNNFIDAVRLVPRAQFKDPGPHPRDVQEQLGAPYAAEGVSMFSILGMPCSAPPWGQLNALDLDTGKFAWRKPLGTSSRLAPFGISLPWGVPSFGAPLITGGGLVFVAATMDDRIRAFRSDNGEELWAVDLPASAQSSPMTYAIGGRQYVVLTAGGHGMMGTKKGDYVIAFALPQK